MPIHYNTFPPIAQDPKAFQAAVAKATGSKKRVEILEPGASYEF